MQKCNTDSTAATAAAAALTMAWGRNSSGGRARSSGRRRKRASHGDDAKNYGECSRSYDTTSKPPAALLRA